MSNRNKDLYQFEISRANLLLLLVGALFCILMTLVVFFQDWMEYRDQRKHFNQWLQEQPMSNPQSVK